MDPRRMCPHCRAFITNKDRVCPYCNEAVGPRTVERGESRPVLGGFIPHAHFVTVMILLINFGLYTATVLDQQRSGGALVAAGAKFGPLIRGGQWWRLVTAGFLHGGMLHILMNSWVLFDLGAQVEEIYGTWKMIVFYFVSTVFGFLASTLWSPNLSVGSSAGIMGLIGAMIAMGVLHKSALGNAIRGMYVRWAVYMLIFGLIPIFRVDNAAHIGGLASGFGIAYLAGMPKPYRSAGERAWQVAAYACLVLTALCFLKMYLWFEAAGK